MSGNQIQQHMDPPQVCLLEQSVQILIRPVPGGHTFVVPDIISGILKGGIKARIDPQGIAAQIPDIIQLFRDPRQIADPIPIGIHKGLGIDLIKHRISQPADHTLISPFLIV